MEEIINIVQPLLVIFAASTVVVLVFHTLKQPPIAGFIFSGALVGPLGLGWIKDVQQVHALSDIGIILLLFSLGTEFSVSRFSELRKPFLLLGSMQCLATTALVAVILKILGYGWAGAFVIGSLVSLSSTAIVLKLLQNRRETVSPHGNVTIAVLLFQDLWVVPLMVVLPILVPSAEQPLGQIGLEHLLRIILFVSVLYFAAKYFVPWILSAVAKTKIRELFLISIVFLALGTAWLSGKLGLSMALGAFFAGMILSSSEYGHQALAEVIPYRDPFLALFFVSIGMLLDFRFFAHNFFVILTLALAILVLKFGVTATSGSLLGYPSRLSAMAAIMLAQIGELSFVIADKGKDLSLIGESDYQYFLSVTLLLLLIAPSLISLAPKLAPLLGSLDFIKHGSGHSASNREVAWQNHVIIIGFGFNGQRLAESLSGAGIPFQAIEMNLDTVRGHKKKNVAIHYGDASKREVLEAAHIGTARMAVVAINDRDWIPHVLHSIRELRPDIHILVRTDYLKGTEQLKKAGADDIVVAEMETAQELYKRTLRRYGQTESESLPLTMPS